MVEKEKMAMKRMCFVLMMAAGSMVVPTEPIKDTKQGIQRLSPADWQSWKGIWLEALQEEPSCFANSYEELAIKNDEYWKKFCFDNTIFCVFCDGNVVGCIGFQVYEMDQMNHKGRLFSLYVNARHRGKGIAKNLIDAVIAHAKTCVEQLICGVISTNLSVADLYERYGFKKYGIEPRALKVKNGSYADIVAFVLFLEKKNSKFS